MTTKLQGWSYKGLDNACQSILSLFPCHFDLPFLTPAASLLLAAVSFFLLSLNLAICISFS